MDWSDCIRGDTLTCRVSDKRCKKSSNSQGTLAQLKIVNPNGSKISIEFLNIPIANQCDPLVSVESTFTIRNDGNWVTVSDLSWFSAKQPIKFGEHFRVLVMKLALILFVFSLIFVLSFLLQRCAACLPSFQIRSFLVEREFPMFWYISVEATD